MTGADVTARMREDWNARAREDAGYYVAFGRRDQDDAGFFATASEVVISLESELKRIPPEQRGRGTALEIGCGPGRLMRPMSRHFSEIHGVDVSDEMIALAREKLRDVPNAYPYATNGASLERSGSESVDFVYSYAVFQHIPSPEVIFEYLCEIRRVLKPGGLARLHFNGLPKEGTPESSYNTWAGVRFSAAEILEFTRAHDFQVLALEGALTQYMWTSWRKQPRGWQAAQRVSRPPAGARIRRITNASSSEPVAPCRGRFACISVWMEKLPEGAGLHSIQVRMNGLPAEVTYIGPPDHSGWQQVNVLLPETEATGLFPIEMLWFGERLCPPATLRVIPGGPLVPRIVFISDGVNLVAENRIETRLAKITLEQIDRPEEIQARIGGLPAEGLEYFCINPREQRYEVNFRLPAAIGAGRHPVEIQIGRRKLAPVMVEVLNRVS
jgi:ubiquinone/menaquinone biosynthesis C-methylase UbiE